MTWEHVIRLWGEDGWVEALREGFEPFAVHYHDNGEVDIHLRRRTPELPVDYLDDPTDFPEGKVFSVGGEFARIVGAMGRAQQEHWKKTFPKMLKDFEDQLAKDAEEAAKEGGPTGYWVNGEVYDDRDHPPEEPRLLFSAPFWGNEDDRKWFEDIRTRVRHGGSIGPTDGRWMLRQIERLYSLHHVVPRESTKAYAVATFGEMDVVKASRLGVSDDKTLHFQHIGIYSESAETLTTIGNRIHATLFSATGDDFEEARANALRRLKHCWPWLAERVEEYGWDNCPFNDSAEVERLKGELVDAQSAAVDAGCEVTKLRTMYADLLVDADRYCSEVKAMLPVVEAAVAPRDRNWGERLEDAVSTYLAQGDDE